MIEKSSAEWFTDPDFEGLYVLDPDGWDRQNFIESWNEKINRDQFENRLHRSTVIRVPA